MVREERQKRYLSSGDMHKWFISYCQMQGVENVYNNQMDGIDRIDQMLTSYEVEQKRVKKWYKN